MDGQVRHNRKMKNFHPNGSTWMFFRVCSSLSIVRDGDYSGRSALRYQSDYGHGCSTLIYCLTYKRHDEKVSGYNDLKVIELQQRMVLWFVSTKGLGYWVNQWFVEANDGGPMLWV